MEAVPLVELRNVVKRFGDNTVLDGINLKIYENQITTIIGKSGTGKSVLLKHIIGLLKPDEGEILFRGKPLKNMKKGEWEVYRSKISYMFQNNALFDSMTVFENVALPLKQTTNLEKNEIQKRVMARLEQLELTEVPDKYPSELSGGMQKRAALARALVIDPTIVLFDEPTTGQDPIRKNAILSMIAHYRKKLGFTAVFISHDIPDVIFISDNVVLLWEGKVGFQGKYEESNRLDNPMMDEFFRSLEGFQDELTGLLSKEMFRSRYSMLLGRGSVATQSFAILFGVEIENLEEALGARATAEVLHALGEYTHRYFEPLGGFSVRHSREQILTIMPHTNSEEGEEILRLFGKELEEKALSGIEGLAMANIEEDSCFEITLFAGTTVLTSNNDIDKAIAMAKSRRVPIAKYLCERRGEEE